MKIKALTLIDFLDGREFQVDDVFLRYVDCGGCICGDSEQLGVAARSKVSGPFYWRDGIGQIGKVDAALRRTILVYDGGVR